MTAALDRTTWQDKKTRNQIKKNIERQSCPPSTQTKFLFSWNPCQAPLKMALPLFRQKIQDVNKPLKGQGEERGILSFSYSQHLIGSLLKLIANRIDINIISFLPQKAGYWHKMP